MACLILKNLSNGGSFRRGGGGLGLRCHPKKSSGEWGPGSATPTPLCFLIWFHSSNFSYFLSWDPPG